MTNAYEIYSDAKQEETEGVFRVLQNWFKLPSNFILLIVPMQCFCCDSNYFVVWSRIFVLFDPYVRFHILSFKFR